MDDRIALLGRPGSNVGAVRCRWPAASSSTRTSAPRAAADRPSVEQVRTGEVHPTAVAIVCFVGFMVFERTREHRMFPLALAGLHTDAVIAVTLWVALAAATLALIPGSGGHRPRSRRVDTGTLGGEGWRRIG
jgi:hypothetical protein